MTDLYLYIAERSGPNVAIGYIRRIREACESLEAFPLSGRSREDLRSGLRILGFERRVAIAYVVSPAGDVEVGRVFYGGRNYEALLSDES